VTFLQEKNIFANCRRNRLQTEARKLEVNAEVPLDAFYKCWHIYPRNDKRYYIADLITEVLSGGGSSRLFQSLVKEKEIVQCR
jgi:predicted Zn-dependent peptidase